MDHLLFTLQEGPGITPRVFLRGFLLYEQIGAGFYFLSVSNYKQGKDRLTRRPNKRTLKEEGDLNLII